MQTTIVLIFEIFLIFQRVSVCISSNSNHCPVEYDSIIGKDSSFNSSQYECAENFLFDKKSQSCQELYVKGNCGDKMIFMPLHDHGKAIFGICMCDNFEDLDNISCTFRPKLYWKPTQSCYFAYEQGPCKSDEWLTYMRSPGLYDRVVCVKNPCPTIASNSEEKSEEDQFWFPFGGNCYLSGSQGFCRENINRAYLSRESFSPLCLPQNSCQNITSAEEEPCIKGYRNRRYVGRCRKKHKIIIQDTL